MENAKKILAYTLILTMMLTNFVTINAYAESTLSDRFESIVAEVKYGTERIVFTRTVAATGNNVSKTDLLQDEFDQIEKVIINGILFESNELTYNDGWAKRVEYNVGDSKFSDALARQAIVKTTVYFKDGSILGASPSQNPIMSDDSPVQLYKDRLEIESINIKREGGKAECLNIVFKTELTPADANHIDNIIINGTKIAGKLGTMSIFNVDGKALYFGFEKQTSLQAAKGESVTVEINFDDGSSLTKQVGKLICPMAENFIDVNAVTSSGAIHVAFTRRDNSKGITEDEVTAINTVIINGDVFERANTGEAPFAYKNGGTVGFDGIHQDRVKAALAKADKSKITVKFYDDSVLGVDVSDNQIIAEDLTQKYTISNLRIQKPLSVEGQDEVRIVVHPKMNYKDAKRISAITLNGKKFTTAEGHAFAASYEGEIKALNDTTITQMLEAAKGDKVTVIITFDQLSDPKNNYIEYTLDHPLITTSNEAPGDTQGTAGFAEGKAITEVKLNGEALNVKISGDYKFDGHIYKFKTITIAGKVFSLSPNQDIKFIQDYKGVVITNAAVLAFVKTIAIVDAEVILSFADKSTLTRAGKLNGGFDLSTPLKDGEYTLTYTIKKDGSEDVSTLGTYFDTKAKLVVSQGVKHVTLLNHKFADMLVDMAAYQNTDFKSFERSTLQKDGKGKPVKVEYTTTLGALNKAIKVAVLVSGPMGGSEGDKGNYHSNSYRKADLYFTSIKAGFSEYNSINDEIIAKNQNDDRLISGLIRCEVDTNNDGKISKEELQSAEGVTMDVYKDGKKLPNVIDLSGLKLNDVSILKDLGPKIKMLILEGNSLTELPADVFSSATGLTHIFLSANDIQTLDADLFKYNINLQYIDTDGNNLGDIPAGLLDHNTKLKTVSFMNSGVTALPQGLFSNCKRLNAVFLQENELESLPDDLFSGQTGFKLRRVELYKNKLKNLPDSLGNAKGLQQLNASHNQIKIVPDSFSNLEQIELLDLEDNNIYSIPDALILNMSKYSLGATHGARLDLSLNAISDLPIEKLSALIDTKQGKALSKFEVDRNLLPSKLDDETRMSYEKVGIKFVDAVTTYLPQRSSANDSATAEKGKIEHKADFDLLELAYFDMGDSENYGGKSAFDTVEQFKKYLLGKGRLQNKVAKHLDRKNAAKAILNNKQLTWKIRTKITKNDTQLILDKMSDLNPMDGLEHSYQDPNMEQGDQYEIIRSIYIKNSVFGWLRTFETCTHCVADKSAEIAEGDSRQISVKMYKSGTEEEVAMAKAYLNHKATLKKLNGKYHYQVQFFTKNNVKIDELHAYIKGVKTPVLANPVDATTDEYTMTLENKVDRIHIAFKVKGMPMEVEADLGFNYNVGTANEDNANKDDNPADGNPSDNVTGGSTGYDEAQQEEFEITGIIAGKAGSIETNPVTGEKFGEIADTVEIALDYDGPSSLYEAMQTWTGIEIDEISYPVRDPGDGKKTFILNEGSFVTYTKYQTGIAIHKDFIKRNKHSVKITFSDRVMLEYKDDGYVPRSDVDPSQKLVLKVRDIYKITALKKQQMATSKQPTITVEFNQPLTKDALHQITTVTVNGKSFDGAGNFLVNAKGELCAAPTIADEMLSIAGDNHVNVVIKFEDKSVLSYRAKTLKNMIDNIVGDNSQNGHVIKHYQVPVTLMKANGTSVSMANAAINQIAKVVEKDGRYTYDIMTKPMMVSLSGTQVEGHLTKLFYYDGDSKKEAKLVSDGHWQFSLSQKSDRIKVAVWVDIMDNMMGGTAGAGEQQALLAFDWSKKILEKEDVVKPVKPVKPSKPTKPTKSDNSGTSANNGNSSGQSGHHTSPTAANKKANENKATVNPKIEKRLVEDEAGRKHTITIKKGSVVHISVDKNNKSLKSPIKVSVKDESYQNNMVVVRIKADGTEEIVKKAYVKDGQMKAMILGDVALALRPTKAEFDDVKQDDWFKESVVFVKSRSILNGVSKHEFAPNMQMTRAMLVTVLHRIEDEPLAKRSAFTDISSDQYYARAVDWAYQKGIVHGDGTNFNPDNDITRQEMAVILFNYMSGDTSVSNNQTLSAFKDGEAVADWATDACAWAVKNGLLKGSNGQLMPQQKLTRAEAATILERVIKQQLD